MALTIEQVKAGRALLRWSQVDLAEASGVSIPTIKRLEAGSGPLAGYGRTQIAMREALERAGVEFIGEGDRSAPAGAGVRLRAGAP